MKDPLSGNWVVFSPERRYRPQQTIKPIVTYQEPQTCPFCYGNEDMTPPEIVAGRSADSIPNSPDWLWRVIPNKFPALRIEGQLVHDPSVFPETMAGIGAHEVLIETPEHDRYLIDFSDEELAIVLKVFHDRVKDLKRDTRFQYVQVFKNQGQLAGATLSHSHSQIIALPFIPPNIEKKISVSNAHFQNRGSCLVCDIIGREREYRKRILFADSDFITFSNPAPRFPFALTVAPISHQACFEDESESSFLQMAAHLKKGLAALKGALNNPAFNLMLQSLPFSSDSKEMFHWYWELAPVLNRFGGFELGSGVFINPFPADEAVEILKSY